MIIANRPKLALELNASDTTAIHRAGMAGLWMSLRELEQKYPNPSQRSGNLTWDLSSTKIVLNWQGRDLPVIDWLLTQSFLINNKGLIDFVGLMPLNLVNQIHTHQAIHDTFLRHNKFYKKDQELSETINIEDKSIKLKYRALKYYANQTFAETLCDESGFLIDGYIPIVSWLYPGATVRHAKLQAFTKIEEKVEYAFALLFLPIICRYFTQISNSTKRDKKQAARYVVVIPDIDDFEAAANRCWHFQQLQYQDCFVTNLGEAALKYYAESTEKITSMQHCQVLLYEKLNKKARQRMIFKSEDFSITPQAVKDYQFVSQSFIDNKIFIKEKSFTIKVNSIRAIIAENLARELSWWCDLWEQLYQTDPMESENLEQQLVFNRRGFLAMLQQNRKLEIYQDFIRAFHEALRRIYAKTYDKKRNKVENNLKIDKKYQSIRSELSQCYNQESLEDFLSDFLSRAGLNSSLYDQWERILPLIVDEVNWKRTRNLSLLALASYKPKGSFVKKLSVSFWTMLLEVNYQVAILILIIQTLSEIFRETELVNSASEN